MPWTIKQQAFCVETCIQTLSNIRDLSDCNSRLASKTLFLNTNQLLDRFPSSGTSERQKNPSGTAHHAGLSSGNFEKRLKSCVASGGAHMRDITFKI